MTNRSLLAAAAALALSCTHAGPAAAPATLQLDARQPAAQALDPDAIVLQAMRVWDVPGASVAVVKNGQVVLARGYGILRQGSREKVDADTLFGLASNTKPFTAAAMALLVKQKKLGWDDKVVSILPGFALSDPSVTPQVTVRDLLSHRVGLPTFGGDFLWFQSTYPRSEVLRRMAKVPLAFPFRSRFGYSNLMFAVAGEVLGKASGTPWEAFCAKNLAAPLGMKRTTFTVAEARGQSNVAAYHTRVGNKWEVIPPREIDAVAPAASMHSSANDMAHWLRFVIGRGTIDGQQILAPDDFDEMWTPQVMLPVRPAMRAQGTHFSAYGLGWFLRDYKGRFMVSHAGGIPGATSQTVVLPEDGVGVTVLTNSDENPAQTAIAMALLDAYAGLRATDWIAETAQGAEPDPAPPAPDSTTAVDLVSFVGSYRSEIYGEATIAQEGGHLELRLSAHPDVHCDLAPLSKERAVCPWSLVELKSSTLSFTEEAGKAKSFKVSFRPDYVDPVEYVFERER